MAETEVLSTTALVLSMLTVFVASIVQTSSGVGFGMVAAPILFLINPQLVPGPLLLLSIFVSLLVAFRERHTIDYPGLGMALGGRIPGTVLAGLTVTLLPAVAFGLIFGILVLCAVLLSFAARAVSPTPKVLFPAGFISGYMGTITSIGAPPMALAYQHQSPAIIRSTMAVYFIIGAAFSIATLAWVGKFGREEVTVTVAFLPALVGGYWISNIVISRLDGRRLRNALLVLCAVAAVVLIIRSISQLN